MKAMTKTNANYSLDSDLVDELRKRNVNMSAYINDLLRKNIGPEEADLEGEKEKIHKELRDLSRKRTELKENLKGVIAKIEIQAQKQKAEMEKMKAEAQEKARLYSKKIAQEISYWPDFVNNGFVSSPAKREAHFRRRAKLLDMELVDYLEEVVKKCDNKVVI